MTHGHDVLHMMEGNSYATKQQLVETIIQKFGAEERFRTCSAENLTAAELVDLLASKGKFKPADHAESFTVDTAQVCHH